MRRKPGNRATAAMKPHGTNVDGMAVRSPRRPRDLDRTAEKVLRVTEGLHNRHPATHLAPVDAPDFHAFGRYLAG